VAGHPQKSELRAVPRHGEGGQRRRRTAAPRHADEGRHRPGPAPAAARPATATPHVTTPSNNNRMAGRRCPFVSNRPLHRVLQQRCHHASASARSPSWPPIPCPRLQRAATDRQQKISAPHCETEFLLTLTPTYGANQTSLQVFVNAGARVLCTLDGSV